MTRVGVAALLVIVALLWSGCGENAHPKRQRGPNRASIGFIDQPVAESVVGPIFAVAGWAIDDAGVERVRFYLDDQLVATAPIAIMRPDLDRIFSLKAGGGAGTAHGFGLMIDAGSRAGYCTIRAEAIDGRGAHTQIATANIRIEP